MGFFSDLFGGESKTGMKASQRENEAVRQAMYDTTQGSREALYDYVPRGIENQRQAYSAMFDLQQQSPQHQLQMLNDSSIGAQGAMLGGLGNYQRAILGMPTLPIHTQGLSGLQGAQQMFEDARKPFFLNQPVRNPYKQWLQNQGGQ